MSRKGFIFILSAAAVMTALTACGKEDGTKYEYAENLIYESEETSIKLLNSTESEEELRLNFKLENFETEDVKVKVYNPEDEEITENIECTFDEENGSVSIKGDVSQVDMAEVELNYKTNLKVKELKNEEFKYLLTNYEDDHGCTYLGDLDDFKVNEEEAESEDEDDEEKTAADGSEEETVKKSSQKVRMTKDEIFGLLKGKWASSDKSFTIEFAENKGEAPYKVTATGEKGYESEVSYFDEVKTDEGDHKIRFVTGGTGYGSCRELLLSADGKSMSYITGIQKNSEDEYEEVFVQCFK